MSATTLQFTLPLQSVAGGVPALPTSDGLPAGKTAGAADIFAALLSLQLGQDFAHTSVAAQIPLAGAATLPISLGDLPADVTDSSADAAVEAQLAAAWGQLTPVLQGGHLEARPDDASGVVRDALRDDASDDVVQAQLMTQSVLPGLPLVLPVQAEGVAAVAGTTVREAGASQAAVAMVAAQPAASSVMPGVLQDRQAVAVNPAVFAVSGQPQQQNDAGVPMTFSTTPEMLRLQIGKERDAVAFAAPRSDDARAMPAVAAAVVTAGQPAVAAQPVSQIHPEVGQYSAWGEALGDKVVWMVGQRHQNVELHLNPPSLGPLEVRLNMSDGQATLTFSTQHMPVKEAIEAATPRLREMMGESGISLGSVSVNVGSFTQQQNSNFAQTNSQGQPRSWGEHLPESNFSEPALAVATRLSGGLGLVDTFV